MVIDRNLRYYIGSMVGTLIGTALAMTLRFNSPSVIESESDLECRQQHARSIIKSQTPEVREAIKLVYHHPRPLPSSDIPFVLGGPLVGLGVGAGAVRLSLLRRKKEYSA